MKWSYSKNKNMFLDLTNYISTHNKLPLSFIK